jgi:hypothetical protein
MNITELSELISLSSGCVQYALADGRCGEKNIAIRGCDVILYYLNMTTQSEERIVLTEVQVSKLRLMPSTSASQKPDFELIES